VNSFLNLRPNRIISLLAAILLVSSMGNLYSQQPTGSQPSSNPSPPSVSVDAEPNTSPPQFAPDSATKADTKPKAPATTNSQKQRKRKSSPASVDEPRKIVIRHGGTSEPTAQIVPGMPAEEAARLRSEMGQLVSATEVDLQRLAARILNANQQETVIQIRHYLDVARNAMSEGDIQRAHTLAFKAHLLSDDLVKH
jgi:hypothetical protein